MHILWFQLDFNNDIITDICVCVCVCEGERERERDVRVFHLFLEVNQASVAPDRNGSFIFCMSVTLAQIPSHDRNGEEPCNLG